jgi:hypothetical protein
METNSFCQRVIEAANERSDKVAMTLIEPEGAEKELSHERNSQVWRKNHGHEKLVAVSCRFSAAFPLRRPIRIGGIGGIGQD